MTNSTSTSLAAVVSPGVHSTAEGTWKADRHVEIPTGSDLDILSFVFGNFGQYDQDQPLFIDANNPISSFSVRQVRTTVRKLIAGLKAHGLGKGDCVSIHAFNSIWYPCLWLAVIGAEGIAFGVNPSSSSTELQHLCAITKPKYVITEASLLDNIDNAASLCNISNDQIVVLEEPNHPVPTGRNGVSSLLQHGELDWTASHNYDTTSHPSRTAAYCTTSGTTGLPKAAAIPHSYVVAQAAIIATALSSRTYQPKQLVFLPVFHTFAQPIALILPLRLGTPTYFLPRFHLESFVKSVQAFQITDVALVPSIITTLLRTPKNNPFLDSLRFILSAGAPITTTLQSKLYHYLHPTATVSQVWGATEVGWVTMFPPSTKDESGSVGTLLPGMSLRLVNETNNMPITSDSTPGEAFIHSPSAFTGYLNNPTATVEAFDPATGFYKTGDRVYVEDNKIFITGRIKETLKVNGWQVSPSEIESVLLDHPAIADVAVDGVTAIDADGLEVVRPRACVVKDVQRETDTGESLTEGDVVRFAAQRLVAYKRLTGGVVFVDSIPRNPTGKIMRRLLPSPVSVVEESG